MRIIEALPDWFEGCDVTMNPELILLRAEGEFVEADIEESMWDAGTHVTQPRRNLND